MKLLSVQMLLVSSFLSACSVIAPGERKPAAKVPEQKSLSKSGKIVKRNIVISDQGWTEAHEPKSHWMVNTEGKMTPVPSHNFPLVHPHAPMVMAGHFDLPDDGESFQGTDRALAKTTISSASVRAVSLDGLLNEFKEGKPKSDQNMRQQHQPALRKDWDFDRVEEEQDNVRVEGWIIATKKETDNDFHIILASSPDVSPADLHDDARWKLLNVEVSGLPPSGTPNLASLSSARQSFKNHFFPTVPDNTSASYTMLEPVHVRITGSLFYDVDHPAGKVGPGNYKPMTSWEIHPISKLTILNN